MPNEAARGDESAMRHDRDDARYVLRGPDVSPAETEPAEAEPTGTASLEAASADQTGPPPVNGGAPGAAVAWAAGPQAPRRSGRALPIALIAAAAVLLLGVAAFATTLVIVSQQPAGNPFRDRTLFVDPDSSAARAAATSGTDEEREAAALIAQSPAAIWLTPEQVLPGTATAAVADLMARAQGADALPVLVVYGITDRDCGGFSSGGLPRAAYLDWVDEIAAGLGDRTSIVVLEPDSLALADECPDPEARTALVRTALARFSDTGAEVYLDGGHSAWLPDERMAELLTAAGVDGARGFATNVSNAQATDDEAAYAARISDALGGGAHAIIDTSRNGAGPPPDGEWCNAPGLALGEGPHALDDQVVDAVLWVKPPGESDGTCNGGPTAGTWWPEQAVELVANADGR
ncbi:glycoside hydrolase family 6 protein [Agromyces sp. NPDC058110]|uniref:glycoside hydrolase family 6 protein n=1 Tax=Agromyces sp. NPDC058110 TaxID=3346345 RepID=UPI0036D7682A